MKYIRMHQVETEPMTRGDYNTFRGWQIPANENPADEGYKVVYPDGYVSWCPKAQFDAAAIPSDKGLPFGYAITQCRYHGKRIKRVGWNGEDQYVEFCKCAVLAIDENKELEVNSSAFVFHFKNRKTGETGIQVGWLASQADMAANDWQIVE